MRRWICCSRFMEERYDIQDNDYNMETTADGIVLSHHPLIIVFQHFLDLFTVTYKDIKIH